MKNYITDSNTSVIVSIIKDAKTFSVVDPTAYNRLVETIKSNDKIKVNAFLNYCFNSEHDGKEIAAAYTEKIISDNTVIGEILNKVA